MAKTSVIPIINLLLRSQGGGCWTRGLVVRDLSLDKEWRAHSRDVGPTRGARCANIGPTTGPLWVDIGVPVVA